MRGSLKKTLALILDCAVVLVVVTTWALVRSSLERGWTDFAAIRRGEEPKYASQAGFLNDGGSVLYEGRLYRVYRVKRSINYQYSDKMGYLVGVRVVWNMPTRMF